MGKIADLIRVIRRTTIQLAILLGLGCQSAPHDAPRDPDPRVGWLADHALRLKSINPDDEDFSDLEPLARLIGAARIVQLGEQSHGDGAAFQTKVRLIKFLHQKLNFDVLAFESGLYDCRKAWEMFRSGSPPLDAAECGIFPIWARSAEVQPLFEHLARAAQSDRPLELCGFDCQFTGAAGATLLGDLAPFLDAATLEPVRQTVDELIGQKPPPPANEQERRLKALDAVRTRLASQEGAEPAFWAQMAESIGAYARQHWLSKGGKDVGWDAVNVRDPQMARNLVWLARSRYPGRKIIVWAASFHVMRNAPTIEVLDKKFSYEKTLTMGHDVWKALGPEVFTLGFVAHEGVEGNAFGSAANIGASSKDSLEDLMARAGLMDAIIGFRDLPSDAWLRQKLVSRPLGYTSMRADWTSVFDGVVFNRRMFPATPVPAGPEPETAEPVRDFIAALDADWARIGERLKSGHAYADKSDFTGVYERWKAGKPDGATAADMEEKLTAWLKEHEGQAGVEWRVRQILSLLAADRGDLDEAARRLEQAMEAYPDTAYEDPSKQSKYQHLVNDRAMQIWDAEGFERALDYAASKLAGDRRYRYFFDLPWTQRLEKTGGSPDAIRTRIAEAYGQREKKFPEHADESRRFAEEMKE